MTLSPKKKKDIILLLLLLAIPSDASAENPQWPNGPDENPLDALPDDPGFIKFNDKGNLSVVKFYDFNSSCNNSRRCLPRKVPVWHIMI